MALSAAIKHDIGHLSTLPLGSILAWHRDLGPERPAPLPPGWVECNGQILDDPESPYHGLEIPNLNGPAATGEGGLFLRGSLRSGVLQGDQLQSHTHIDAGHQHPRNPEGVAERVLLVPSETGDGHAAERGDGNSTNVGELTGTAQARLGEPVGLRRADQVRHGAETRPVNMSVVWIMKVKPVTTVRAVPAVQAHEGAPVGAVYIGAEGNVGIGQPAPGVRLDVEGRILGAGTVEAWSAERTGFLVVEGDSPWADIPGLSIAFRLARPALVHLTANGTQRAAGGMIQVTYRYLVDEAPRGDPDFGLRVLSNGEGTDPWNIWSLTAFEMLNAGTHTITFQARNTTGGVGVICGERGPAMAEFAGGVLNVLAIYQ